MIGESYDGLQDDRHELHSGKSSRKTIAIVILLGVAILVLAVVFGWNKLFPAEEEETVQSSQAAVVVQPPVAAQVQKVDDAPQLSLPEVQPKAEAVVDDPVVEESNPQPVAEAPQSRTTAVNLAETSKPRTTIPSGDVVQFADHTVKAGETLDSIASAYGLKVSTILSVNQIRNINAVTEGVTLRIPDRDGQIYVIKSGDMLSSIARNFGMGWHALMEVNGLTSDRIMPDQKLFIPDTEQGGASPKAAEVAPVTFVRPAKGRIVGKFGQDTGEENLQGILIQGSWGDAVVAAAEGDVVDAGNVQGKGRFVVLSHTEGYRTTYAHMENVDVHIGDKVSQGQTLGSIGNSGTQSDEPTLFFSIEQSGYALDPASFF